jgi:hypothetical protein
MDYDWAGTRILQKNTALLDKRRVFENFDAPVLTDLREWITPGDREQIRSILKEMKLPAARTPGNFDKRARIVWRWVVDHIRYVSDPQEQKLQDYWQFPAETLAVRKGDCEDCAFLLASLLLGSGISSYCVRVAIGTVHIKNMQSEQHAWVMYKNESGRWCILEATLPRGECPRRLPHAEKYTQAESNPRYTPILCLNSEHVWQVGRQMEIQETEAFLSDFSKRKERLKDNHKTLRS